MSVQAHRPSAMEAQQAEGEGVAQEEQQHGPIRVVALQHLGIAAADIKKLQEGGIWTLEGLTYAPKKDLTGIKGLSEAKARASACPGSQAPVPPAPPPRLSRRRLGAARRCT
jgi:hypothetical protein